MKQINLIGYPDNFHNKHFLPLLENKNRYLVLCGGGGSGKSRFVALKILDRFLFESVNHRLLLIRKTLPSLRRSSFQLIHDYIRLWNLESSCNISKFNMSIENLQNKNQIIAAGMDDPEKLKSIERVTGVWIEEATELTYDDFTQIDLRLRGDLGTYKQIILSFNPIDESNWIKKIFFDRTKEDTLIDHSTVEHNQFIDTDYKKVLDRLKEEDRNKYNIYRLGLWGRLENIIYSNWNVVDKLPESFDEMIYGLDFGFNNPNTLVEIGVKDQNVYLRELLYQPGLTNQDLISKLEKFVKNRNCSIYADSAEPARIEEIKRAGFNVYPSNKSVSDGIDFVKRIKLNIESGSDNIVKEISQYSYKKDKNGNILEEPVKFMDHAMDAIRYALYTHMSMPPAAMYGVDPEPEQRMRLFR